MIIWKVTPFEHEDSNFEVSAEVLWREMVPGQKKAIVTGTRKPNCQCC